MFKMSNPENFGGNFSLFCEFLIFTFLVASMPKPPNTRRRTRYILSTVNAKRLPIALAPSWVSYRLDLSTDANPRPIGKRKIRKNRGDGVRPARFGSFTFPNREAADAHPHRHAIAQNTKRPVRTAASIFRRLSLCRCSRMD